MSEPLFTYHTSWRPDFGLTLDNYRKPDWSEWGILLSLDRRSIGFRFEVHLAGVLFGLWTQLRDVEVHSHYDGEDRVMK